MPSAEDSQTMRLRRHSIPRIPSSEMTRVVTDTAAAASAARVDTAMRLRAAAAKSRVVALRRSAPTAVSGESHFFAPVCR